MAEWRERDRVGTSADTSGLLSPGSRYQKAVLWNNLEFLNKERKGKEREWSYRGYLCYCNLLGVGRGNVGRVPKEFSGTLPKKSREVPKACLGAGLKARREVKPKRPVSHTGDLAHKVRRVPWAVLG